MKENRREWYTLMLVSLLQKYNEQAQLEQNVDYIIGKFLSLRESLTEILALRTELMPENTSFF